MVDKDRMVHHRLGAFQTTKKIFENITGFSAILDDPSTAQTAIDDAFYHCKKYRTPVYLSIPSDMVDQKCCKVSKKHQLCNPLKTEEFWVLK
jgi:TPP-dependent 2-oxoacid decarboxylase